MISILSVFLSLLVSAGCADKVKPQEVSVSQTSPGKIKVFSAEKNGYIEVDKVTKSNEEWKKELDPLSYEVTREQGTERSFTGKLLNNHAKGIYSCICCGNDLFSSETKFESGTGWPSFWQPIAKENVGTTTDYEIGYARTEVHCARCGAHLGHVFDDGPKPTGLRYCMNSVALTFKKAE